MNVTLYLVFCALMFFVGFAIGISVLFFNYNKSEYKKQTNNGLIKTIKDKGLYGEYKTFETIDKLNIYKKMYINAYIPKDDGTTTEIDLIMVCEHGLYIIESKNYGGFIYGNQDDHLWTQVFNRNSKFPFYNPIKQNENHIKAINKLLNLNEKAYDSYVVFSERCKLQNVKYDKNKVTVLKRNHIFDDLVNNVKQKDKLLTKKDIENIDSKLKQYICVTDEVKLKHIENIKKIKTEVNKDKIKSNNNVDNQDDLANKSCPKCKKGHLILRTAKSGNNKGNEFYGCSKYPSCRYIENIDK